MSNVKVKLMSNVNVKIIGKHLSISATVDLILNEKVADQDMFLITSKYLSKMILVPREIVLEEDGLTIEAYVQASPEKDQFYVVFESAYDEQDNALVPEATVKSVRFAGILELEDGEDFHVQATVKRVSDGD